MGAHGLHDLMSSIDAVELRRPLLVRPMGDGEYELVCGDRRFAAMHRLGHEMALVEIREMTDRQAAVTAFVDD
jgi:ParB family chromosome partitioning protein